MKNFTLFFLSGVLAICILGCQNTTSESTATNSKAATEEETFKDSLADALQSINAPQKKEADIEEEEEYEDFNEVVYNGKSIDLAQFKARPYLEVNPQRRARLYAFQWENEINVHTMQEFIEALGSNRTLIVHPGIYVFADANPQGGGEEGEPNNDQKLENWSEFYDEQTIHDVENLTIIGKGKMPPAFLQPDSYSQVLRFKNCSNIYLNNLILGHHPEAGWCMGGVFFAHDCRKIRIENSVLFGSGTEGLSLVSVEDLTLSYSWITQCTEQLSSFSHSRKIMIENSRISNNLPELRGFSLYDASLTLKNSEIDQPQLTLYMDRSAYGNDYDVFFLLDKYDNGEWFVSKNEIKDVAPPLGASEVIFESCTVNGESVSEGIL